jgi:hypothetical protein
VGSVIASKRLHWDAARIPVIYSATCTSLTIRSSPVHEQRCAQSSLVLLTRQNGFIQTFSKHSSTYTWTMVYWNGALYVHQKYWSWLEAIDDAGLLAPTSFAD